MQEHKCPKCGNVFSSGICCPKCGTVFLFENSNQNAEVKQDIQKIKENCEMANEIMSTPPKNDYEQRRREIIEELMNRRRERAKEQERQLQMQNEAEKREAEAAKKREEMRKEAEKRAEEARRLAETKRIEEEQNEKRRYEEEQRKLEAEKSAAHLQDADSQGNETGEDSHDSYEASGINAQNAESENENFVSDNVTSENDVLSDANFAETKIYRGFASQLNNDAQDQEPLVENGDVQQKAETVSGNEIEKPEPENLNDDNAEGGYIGEMNENQSEDADYDVQDEFEDEASQYEDTAAYSADEYNEEYANDYGENVYDDTYDEYYSDKSLQDDSFANEQGMASLQSCDIIKDDTVFVKFLRKLLITLYTLTLFAAFMPFTKLVTMSASYGVSLIDFAVAFPLVCGLVISIAEKKYVRKFIFGTIVGLIYLGGYIVIKRAIPPKTTLDIIYTVLFGLILLTSITALFADRNPAFKKFCLWFDSFSYITLFINAFVLIFVGLIWAVAPTFIAGSLKMYAIAIMAIAAINILSCILMIKHKSGGADLFLTVSIAWIVLVVVGYNQMMETVGYRINLNYMHSIGNAYSYFIAACVVFPILLFTWLRIIRAKEKK